MHCEPVNEQMADWNDRFEVSVAGDILTVQRVDTDSGWGQHLVLRYHQSS